MKGLSLLTRMVELLWCWGPTHLLTKTRLFIPFNPLSYDFPGFFSVEQVLMKLLFKQAEEVVKMMEIELGSGWIGHQHCKVHTVLLHLKNLTCNLDFDYWY